MDECRKLIAKYEHANVDANNNNTSSDRLSFAAFVKYMNDPSQFLRKLEKTERVYQNMHCRGTQVEYVQDESGQNGCLEHAHLLLRSLARLTSLDEAR